MNAYRQLVRRSRLYPVLRLESWLSETARRRILTVGIILILVFAGLIFPGQNGAMILGILFLLLSLLVCLWCLELFFRSYYYESIITNEYRERDLFTFTVGRILIGVEHNEVLRAFLLSATGRLIFSRLGIARAEVDNFLATSYRPTAELIPLAPPAALALRELVAWLWQTHAEWREWLAGFDLEQDDLLGVTAWVVREIETGARRRRWWSKENLDWIPGLAGDWSYGGTYTLTRYAQDLTGRISAEKSSMAWREETAELERVLARSREANALLVGEDSDSALAVLSEFAARLQTKHLWLFSVARFLAAFKERQALEQEWLKVLAEVVAAGNVILAIDDLPRLLAGGESLGADPAALLDPYLAGRTMQVVAVAEREAFHRLIEPRATLMARLEKIDVSALAGEEAVLAMLEDIAGRLAVANHLVITYPALREIYRNAEQYFPGGALADKAADLLAEAVPLALARGARAVDKTLIAELTRAKTHIPVGAIDEAERGKLLGLEAVLKARVIGQAAALTAVAGAMRRGRAGVRNPNRPIGSFLFLGPTGVGKTETAKALAATFFGREDALLRLDMSEYQAGDALERLIGSFATGAPGILANLLRQNPYGVLLLDEFEKTNREVLNLFLQILDEGFFSDMLGKRVNARNLIFIATSNAGAETIWQMVRAGRDPAGAKDELVDSLVKSGVYKPELLNRFDDIIIFHPLQPEELKQVAKLLLAKLAERLAKQGISLEITDELAARVAAGGSNEEFGARPMQRFIQDQVEERLAEALIRGEIRSGARVTLDQELKLVVVH